jgi:hypothetical protein
MTRSAVLSISNVKTRTILFDVIALCAIAFLPAVSHMLSFPLYLIEPMRILLILSIAHTSQKNAFIIAAALPISSFILSAHPVMFKMFLITSEMIINAWLFFFLSKKIKNTFGAALISILSTKIYYYIVKFGLISAVLIQGDLIATPIYLQVVVAFVLSGYLFFTHNKKAAE